ncbi:hypothetical protein ACFFR6_40320, partial [Saccharothrix mutabilis subsp. capreolus]
MCAKYASGAGFSGNDLVEAIAIGMGESDCRTYFNDPTPQDQGMWQIQVVSSDPWRNGTYGDLRDPSFNARATYHLSGGGANWHAWSTYTDPLNPRYYGNYLPAARIAAQKYNRAARYSGDFDGNGLTDFTVYRPTTGNWHILYNDGSTYTRPWGGS